MKISTEKPSKKATKPLPPTPAPSPSTPSSKGKVKKYQLRALGYCVEVTAHKLSKKESKEAQDWCESEGCPPDEIMGSLEVALGGYDCYSTNLWQSGMVPVLGSVRLVLTDSNENEIFTIKEPLQMKRTVTPGTNRRVDRANEDTLVYFEESKGLVASWVIMSNLTPSASDFSLSTDKLVIDYDETEFITGVHFKGEELERDDDEEDVRGKAAYSMLL